VHFKATDKMSITVHDLRVLIRDKTKVIDDLHRKIDELRLELEKRDRLLRESDANIKKKDEILSIKEMIIKEKDVHILKLETELLSLNKSDSSNVTSKGKQTTNINESTPKNAVVNGIHQTSSKNELKLTPIVEEKKKEKNINTDAQVSKLKLPNSSKEAKSKRIAISAEPAQTRYNKTKEQRPILKEFFKSDV
jgi:hypothetical protein